MKEYAVHVLAGILLCLFLVFSFNLLVNPYDLFSVPDIEGVNTYKSETGRYTRLVRVYQVERERPEVILLASSRGMEIPDAYISGGEMKASNLSLTSASTYELYRMFQHAVAVGSVRKVVLALDESFSEARHPGFDENRFLVRADGSSNSDRWRTYWHDVFNSLFSLDALRDSLRTVKKQKEDPSVAGYREYMARRVYRAGGHRMMFRKMEAGMFSAYHGQKPACSDVLEVKSRRKNAGLEYFRKLVKTAYEKRIELVVYFSPVHARFYQAKCMIGEWAAIEDMKRKVVDVIEGFASVYHVRPYAVWDFSGYNDVTTEPVPAMGDRTSLMEGYYEGSHYTRMTAKKIFDRIYSGLNTSKGFGRTLESGMIDLHLEDIRIKRNGYVKTHRKDIDELVDLFFDTRRLNNRM